MSSVIISQKERVKSADERPYVTHVPYSSQEYQFLYTALYQNDLEGVKKYIKFYDNNKLCLENKCLLCIAIHCGEDIIVDYLLSIGIKPNCQPNCYPFHLACQRNMSNIVQSSILHKAVNINQRNPNTGKTLLHEACLYYGNSVFELLVESGADVNIPYINPSTLEEISLIRVIYEKEAWKCLATLLNTRIDPGDREFLTKCNFSVLTYDNYDPKFVGHLLEAGVPIWNKDGPDTFSIAFRKKRYNLIFQLIASIKSPKEVPIGFCNMFMTEVFELAFYTEEPFILKLIDELIRLGLNPTECLCSFLKFTKHLWPKIVEKLFSYGANYTGPGTLFHFLNYRAPIIIWNEDTEKVARMLLERTEDINRLYNDKSVLDDIINKCQAGYFLFLLSNGAKPSRMYMKKLLNDATHAYYFDEYILSALLRDNQISTREYFKKVKLRLPKDTASLIEKARITENNGWSETDTIFLK